MKTLRFLIAVMATFSITIGFTIGPPQCEAYYRAVQHQIDLLNTPAGTVIDTIYLDGAVYELGLVSLADMDINMKHGSYVDLVNEAKDAGWELCPSDSMSLKRIAAKIPLDPDNRKFNAYVATAPFRSPEGSWNNEFRIPEIYSRSDGAAHGVGSEIVGYFAVDGFKDVFPPLGSIIEAGYRSISHPRMVMYDWVFIRKIAKANL